MGCFPCFKSKKSGGKRGHHSPEHQNRDVDSPPPPPVNNCKNSPTLSNGNNNAEAPKDGSNSAKAFTFRELAAATKNFRQECLLGEGGIGRIYKGTLQSTGQVVAVRQLDRAGTQGSEFQAEVATLSQLHHPNLVEIIGYCADGDQRLVVYEYMPSGSLGKHLFENKRPLNWSTRMKIALGIAEGLKFLHETANPPIVYRDLKSSNIVLDDTNTPKLSEYGLAKLLQSDDKLHVSPRVMSSYGYCAPEYERHGEVSIKSDVYSYGVVLLELITGRRAFDASLPRDEQTLVSWAQPYFRDPKRFPDMADPLLENEFPVASLNQAVGVTSMCLQDEPSVRPYIADVVAALSFLAMAPPESPIPPGLVPILSGKLESEG